MIIDLHLHSHYSPDGRHSIPQLLDLFSEGDIAGLTDHETIGGWPEFEKEANKRGIKPVLGIEWFAPGCHILAYFFDGVPNAFYQYMKARRATEKSCMHTLYEEFRKDNPRLKPYNEALKLRAHPENILGLPGFAVAVSKASDIAQEDAEDIVRRQKRAMPDGTRPEPFNPEEIIKNINGWNAVPVLAHPYRCSQGKDGREKKETVENKIRELANAGIKGVDVYSWNSNQEELEHLLGLCDELKLAPIVGSDFHHANKGLRPQDLNALDRKLIQRIFEWIENLAAPTL